MTEKQATDIFINVTENNQDYIDAVNVVLSNTEGECWLIGGFVYRNIVNRNEVEKIKLDLDFIVEKPIEVKLPPDWKFGKNSYDNMKFRRDDGLEIDFVPLEKVHSIIRRGLKPTIENFLTGTPLNIQSICFDVKNQKVIGDIGLASISDRVIKVNDEIQAKIYSERKKKDINKIISEKATSLGFKPIYPELG